MNNLDTSKEKPNLKAVNALSKHGKKILASLSDLESKDPQSEVIKEIERLGGIGVFGMSLNRINDLTDQSVESIGVRSAGFVVAFLNSYPIQSFIVQQCNEELTLNDISHIRDIFINFL